MSEELRHENVEETPVEAEVVDPYLAFRDERMRSWREGDAPIVERAEFERQSYQNSLENMQHFSEQFEKRAESLRGDIDEKKSGLLSRILHFRQIRDLESELGITEHQARRSREMADERAQLIAQYDRIIAEENELGALMEEAQKENEAWDEEKRHDYLESERRRDLTQLSREHKTFFVHDIVTAAWKPSENNEAVNTKQMDWGDQFDVLLGLEPTIAASTLDHAHGGEQRTFGQQSWGVFLSGGRVLGGNVVDAGTRAYGLYDRVVPKGKDDPDAIEHAITGRGEGHNELIIEKPEIAGVYAKWFPDIPLLPEMSLQNTKSVGYDGWWKNMRKVMDRNVPVFVLTQDGRTKMLYDIDPESRTFKVTDAEFEPEHLSDLPGIYKQHLGEEERKKAVMRVFDKVSGALTEDQREQFAPDSSEHTPDDSPYRLHQ